MASKIGCTSAQCLVQHALKKINATQCGLSCLSFEEICYEVEDKLELCVPVFIKKSEGTGDSLLMSCESPIGRSCLEIIEDFQDNVSSNIYRITEYVHYILRIPEAISSALFKAGCDKNYFNYALYIDRLCDSVLLLLLQCPSNSGETHGSEYYCLKKSTCNTCTKHIVQSIVKFGHIKVFLSRLKVILLEKFPSEYTTKQLVIILIALFELSSTECFSKTMNISTGGTKYWLDFFFSLLELIEDHHNLTKFVERYLLESLNELNWENVSVLKFFAFFKDVFPNAFFVSICLHYKPSRQILKFIYDIFLSHYQQMEKNWENSLLDLSKFWGRKKWTEQSSIEADTSLTSAIIYVLLNFEKIGKKVSNDMLSHVLDGVSLRLESTREVRFRENGMTVAAAYAVTTVEVDSQVLMQNEDFSRLYNNWVNEEKKTSNSLANDNEILRTEAQSLFNCVDCFPLNPDRSFFYFGVTRTSPLEKRIEIPSSDETLSFGMTTREADNLDPKVEVLDSFKECFNALIGVGKPVNAQLVDIQLSIESGLRGLYRLLERCHKNERVREAFKKELGPLCPTLLHTLINLSIHAPENKLKELLSIRFYVLVHIIVSTPKISLFCLSHLLYSGTLGILQRAEIARAIGDAAILLANEVQSYSDEVALPKKKIYPPIYSSGKQGEKIIGRNVRKWGFAAHNKNSVTPVFSNSLGNNVESFIQALLVRHDQEHFKFFQDHDPYTPSEILRSLMKIFQSIPLVRHVAPSACRKNIDFFFLVLSNHSNNSVKHLCWITFEEVMRCWCGAPSRFFCLGESISVNSVKVTHTSVLSKEWLDALELGRQISTKLMENNDPLQHISVDVVASLHELVLHQRDFTTLTAAYNSRVTLL